MTMMIFAALLALGPSAHALATVDCLAQGESFTMNLHADLGNPNNVVTNLAAETKWIGPFANPAEVGVEPLPTLTAANITQFGVDDVAFILKMTWQAEDKSTYDFDFAAAADPAATVQALNDLALGEGIVIYDSKNGARLYLRHWDQDGHPLHRVFAKMTCKYQY